jgi:hypothetical protein
VIKQFNFYDIYGYFLPGVAFLGLLWVPIGIIWKSWPDQDISKALFLAVLAYLLGHLLQTIAIAVVPSTVMRDNANRSRFPSDRLLDKNCSDLGEDFKDRLAKQTRKQFGLTLHVDKDGDGTGVIFQDRNTAFFEARSYLIAKKTAHYVEQFEGLYAMMRGLGSAFLAGASYLAGWSLAIYRNQVCVEAFFRVIAPVAALAALINAILGLSRKPKVSKPAVVALAISILAFSLTAGFWVAVWQPAEVWKNVAPRTELILWVAVCLTLVAAARCFSAYRFFATEFAKSIWRDFSVYLTVKDEKGAGQDNHDDKDDDGDDE